MEYFPQDVWFKGMMDMYETLVNPAATVRAAAAA
jgi:hypothetical protein